VEGISMWETF